METTASEITDVGAPPPRGADADLPPEFCHYRDEGCEFSPSCLSCRFPRCLYEEPRGRQRWVKGQRNREIARLFATGRWSARELAERFGLSQRTVQRALKSTIKTAAGTAPGEEKGV